MTWSWPQHNGETCFSLIVTPKPSFGNSSKKLLPSHSPNLGAPVLHIMVILSVIWDIEHLTDQVSFLAITGSKGVSCGPV